MKTYDYLSSGDTRHYLCFKTIEELFGMESEIQAMADRLAKVGYAPDAALETMETLLEIRQAKTRLESRRRRLEKIWQTVEWCDSGDCNESQVKSALEEYLGNEIK